jgi:hypothetical protein
MKWIVSIFLLSFSLLLLLKGINLWTALGHADGSGIAISFIGIEISGRAGKEAIPGYALGFTIAGLIPLFVLANIFIRPLLLKGERSTRQSV